MTGGDSPYEHRCRAIKAFRSLSAIRTEAPKRCATRTLRWIQRRTVRGETLRSSATWSTVWNFSSATWSVPVKAFVLTAALGRRERAVVNGTGPRSDFDNSGAGTGI